jgi:hypothetical protein
MGTGRRFVHRLKPVSDVRNSLKRVERLSSALQRTLAIRRRFESAGLAETMTNAKKMDAHGNLPLPAIVPLTAKNS